jgi:hypothetical protein
MNNNNLTNNISAKSSSSSYSAAAATTTGLGGSLLRALVTGAARKDVEQSGLDLQGIVWMEHINLIVGRGSGPTTTKSSLAESFYLDVLGCTRDDAGKSFHVNLGQQQFHLAVSNISNNEEEDEPPQHFAGGSIGLAVPDLDSLRDRIQGALASGLFDGTQLEVLSDIGDCVTLQGPWGNIFHLYSTRQMPTESKSKVLDSSPPSASTMKMVNAHSSTGGIAAGVYGSHRMAIRDQPGIRYLEIPCPIGQASAVASFYREMMKCTVHTMAVNNTNNNSNSNNTARQAVLVSVGPGIHLVFVENDNASTSLMQQQEASRKGVHICVYTHDFKGLYERLKERDLIWTNPRFLHLDSCDTWEEAFASRTLRFKSIVDLSTTSTATTTSSPPIILELEHETRPLRHGQFLKVSNYESR